MQETKYFNEDDEEQRHIELFKQMETENKEDMLKRMDERLNVLQNEGHTFVRRIELSAKAKKYKLTREERKIFNRRKVTNER